MSHLIKIFQFQVRLHGRFLIHASDAFLETEARCVDNVFPLSGADSLLRDVGEEHGVHSRLRCHSNHIPGISVVRKRAQRNRHEFQDLWLPIPRSGVIHSSHLIFPHLKLLFHM